MPQALALSLTVVSSAHAVSATWNGSSSGVWATTGNWSASPVPGTGNTATFNAASPNTGINLGAGVLINTLLFNTASAAAYTLGTGAVGSQTLTLNDSGAITVNSTVSTSQLVNANVVLELNATPAAYSFTNNSATNGQLLTIAGGVSSGLGSSPPSALKTLTLGGSANGLISGIISGDGSGGGSSKTATVAITKTGAGMWTLSGANIYTGLSTVTTGTLLANNTSGSGTGFGAVSVGVAGILGGTGTIAPTGTNAINVSGVLAPGGSVGTGNFTFNLTGTTGSVTMASGSGFEYQLGAAGLNIGATGTSDLLTLAGAAASDFAFSSNTINFLNTGAIGYYKLFDTSSNLTNTWTGLTVGGTGLITAGLTVSNLTAGLTGSLIMGGSVLGGTTGDIYLQVVPEPSAALLGGIGALLLLRRRRDS